ncbi:sperm-associated microtubule inner protein 5 isoform 1-T2 [Thomomys bottae]
MKPSKTTFMREVPVTPGYSGFVPYLSCQESSNEDRMDYCIKAFQEKTQRLKDDMDRFYYSVATNKKLKPVCSEERVLRSLHDYARLYHPMTLECKYVKKPLHEPPIPGWAGYLPRARVTELGCAMRYTVMAKHCYEDFLDIIEKDSKAKQETYANKYKVISEELPHPSDALQLDKLPPTCSDLIPSGGSCPTGGRPLSENSRVPTDDCAQWPNVSCHRKMHLDAEG